MLLQRNVTWRCCCEQPPQQQQCARSMPEQFKEAAKSCLWPVVNEFSRDRCERGCEAIQQEEVTSKSKPRTGLGRSIRCMLSRPLAILAPKSLLNKFWTTQN